MSETRRTRAGRRGSAFILALIVIMLLTIMGLSLSVVTQTEMQLGVTEKTVERQEYAAETGVWTKVARLLTVNDWGEQRVALLEERDTGKDIPGRKIAFAVQTTSAYQLASRCPPLTDCGEDIKDAQHLAYFVLISSTAKRVSFPANLASPFETAGPGRWSFGSGIDELGQASVSMGFFLSPVGKPSAKDALESDKANGLSKITP